MYDLRMNMNYWEDYVKHCIMIECECGYKKPIPEDIYMKGIRELECSKCKRILKSIYKNTRYCDSYMEDDE